jgi:hypothetical protein
MLRNELIILKMWIAATDAVDFLRLTRREPLLRVQTEVIG